MDNQPRECEEMNGQQILFKVWIYIIECYKSIIMNQQNYSMFRTKIMDHTSKNYLWSGSGHTIFFQHENDQKSIKEWQTDCNHFW